ncbi:hypothetical protein DB42_AQ00310 [Neochlamydia sp. EPS4]|nr:hypothetical protein DB42_AQ00310 [Neochlamydia sp. EPS4]
MLKRKTYLFIPKQRMGAIKKAEIVICHLKKWRWQVERAISWLQRKFRRTVVRWERQVKWWKGLLNFSPIMCYRLVSGIGS